MRKSRLFVAVCFLSCPQLVVAGEDISLDKLSDCAGITKIRTVLDSNISNDCRSPRDSIERKLISQYASNPSVRTCLLASQPIVRLNRFICVDMEYQGTRELACFRSTYESALTKYTDGEKSGLDTRAVKYVNEISACSFPHSDATPAPDSVFPTIFRAVAKPRFGFALSMGSPRNVLAYHGFADLDPAIDSGGLGAIEMFDIFKTNPISVPAVASTTAKGITLTVNDFLDKRPEIESALKQQFGLPAVAKMRVIELKYGGPNDVPMAKRRSDLDVWLRDVTSVLKNVGFREPTQSELASMHLNSTDDLRKIMVRSAPFALGDSYKRILGSFVFLVDDEFAKCVQVAEVMVQEPEDEVMEDYGSMAILLIGLGDCYRAEDTLSDGLLANATRKLRNEVNKR
jgi:hypothetical protein